MDTVKALFPLSFKERTVNQLVVSILVYIGVDVVCGIACAILGIIPFLGALVANILGTVVGVYTLAGIVLAVLNHLDIIK